MTIQISNGNYQGSNNSSLGQKSITNRAKIITTKTSNSEKNINSNNNNKTKSVVKVWCILDQYTVYVLYMTMANLNINRKWKLLYCLDIICPENILYSSKTRTSTTDQRRVFVLTRTVETNVAAAAFTVSLYKDTPWCFQQTALKS